MIKRSTIDLSAGTFGLGTTFANGDVMRVTGVGNTITVYKNGVAVFTGSDSKTGTQYGIGGFPLSTGRFDDFTITTPGGAINGLPVNFDGLALAGWSQEGGTWDVHDGEIRSLTQTTPSVLTFNIARYDLGIPDIDITFVSRRLNTGGHACFYFGYDPATQTGYRLRWDFGGGFVSRLQQISAWQTDASTGTSISGNGIIGSSLDYVSAIRVVYDSASGVIDIYQGNPDGSSMILRGSFLVPVPLTGTWVGIGTTMNPATDGNQDWWGPSPIDVEEYAAPAHPLKNAAGTTLACMVPEDYVPPEPPGGLGTSSLGTAPLGG